MIKEEIMKNLIIKSGPFLIILSIALLFLYCSKEGTGPIDAKFVIPESDISFVEDIQPMLEFYCAMDRGCHSPFDSGNKLSYQVLITKVLLMNHQLSSNGERLIEISKHQSHPEQAPFYILLKRGYPQDEDIMPPYPRSPLPEGLVEGVKRWIGEGAKD